MSIRFAFVGIRHPHILDMYQRCRRSGDIELVACCEQDAATRAALSQDSDVELTHDDFDRMLAETDCAVVAVGDCYARRSSILTRALEAGKHVISDKPLCISLAELDRIESLARERELVVGCMLDMRDMPVFLGLRQAIQEGKIGEVLAISFDGQHPLLYGQRPMWYFEDGMHGGVLNDIAIHAVDFVPWATGLRIKSIVAARSWNATVPQHPHFQQCGQAMLTLQNGAGVIFDVSYVTPDSFGYELPFYWRFTFWGTEGVLEAGANGRHIRWFQKGLREAIHLSLPAGRPGAYLEAFLRETRGQSEGLHLSSPEVLVAARTALRIQAVADDGLAHVKLDTA